MRILFLGAHFPRPNNPTNGTWALSQVKALRDAGHEIKVISPVAAVPRWVTQVTGRGTSALCPPQHTWDGIEAQYIPWTVYPVGPLAGILRRRPGLMVKSAWALSSGKFEAAAAAFKPDLIYAHHGQLAGYIASKLARKRGVPFFITEHDFDEIDACAANPARQRYYADLVRGISGWICVANRMRDSVKRIFPGAPAITVHNGAERIPDELRKVPRPPEWEGHTVILCVGFFYARKNIPLLIQSFDRIADKHPDALLAIAGDGVGELKEAVVAAQSSAKHASRIVLLGSLPHRDVLQRMVWCDALALIGGDEPFGTVFTETMMAGRPIVYASDGGITDVVDDGVQGLAVTAGDGNSAAAALDRLLGDKMLRERLGGAAHKLANEELTWPRNAQNMTRLFEEALKSRSR